VRNGIRALAFAATAAAGLATGAGASEACPEFARAYVTYPVREPYQLARHHIAEDAQYRLMDSGQFRLQGAARCASPVIRASVGGHRSLILAPDYRPSMLGGAYHALINATAKALNLQADLLHAVIAVESAYDPKALSPKGAQGLMQLMPATARLYTVSNPYDPGQNVRAGARHLRYLLGEFDNDLALALAAYNAGAEAVRRYRNTIPPYPETRDYVRRVIQLYHRRLNSY
jgi:soluble lytic murein transglycosylase-like protein